VFPEGVSRRFQKRKRDILLGTWNVRCLYKAGLLTAAARELARYKLDLVVVQEVRWDKEGKMDFQEVGGGRRDWMELAQDRDRWRVLVSKVKNLRVP
jgi:hypothetical protein